MEWWQKLFFKWQQYWNWTRFVALIVNITFISATFTSVWADTTTINISHRATSFPAKSTPLQRSGISGKSSENSSSGHAYKLPINSKWNKQAKSQPPLGANNNYRPYIELGGIKYFSRTSSGAGVYDLFIPWYQHGDTHLFFSDFRLFDRSGSSFEGNLHFGYRRLDPKRERLIGIYAAFDRKRSEERLFFSQLTLGGEYWRAQWFVGLNFYQPFGKRQQLGGSGVAGDNRAIVTSGEYVRALGGVDGEIGYAFNENLTGYLGGYYFHAADTPTISGPKMRLTYNYQKVHGRILGILDGVGLEGGVQHDQVRGMSGYLGIKFRFGLTELEKNSNVLGFARHMVEPIRRDPDIITTKVNATTSREEDLSKWDTYALLQELGLTLTTTLQGGKDKSKRQIAKAYYRLALLYHPDRGGESAKMVRLNTIYNILQERFGFKIFVAQPTTPPPFPASAAPSVSKSITVPLLPGATRAHLQLPKHTKHIGTAEGRLARITAITETEAIRRKHSFFAPISKVEPMPTAAKSSEHAAKMDIFTWVQQQTQRGLTWFGQQPKLFLSAVAAMGSGCFFFIKNYWTKRLLPHAQDKISLDPTELPSKHNRATKPTWRELLLPTTYSHFFSGRKAGDTIFVFSEAAPPQLNLLQPPQGKVTIVKSAAYHKETSTNLSDRVNLAYAYEDQDIDRLLHLRLQEVGVDLTTTIPLAPLDNFAINLQEQLREELTRSAIRGARTLLIPLNLYNIHWVGLVIRFNAAHRVELIQYIDPLGEAIPPDILLALQEVYGNNINVHNVAGLRQSATTGMACGPLTIENLVSAAQNQLVNYRVTSAQMHTLRNHHIELLELLVPELQFYFRQRENLRTFECQVAPELTLTGGLCLPQATAAIASANDLVSWLQTLPGFKMALAGGTKSTTFNFKINIEDNEAAPLIKEHFYGCTAKIKAIATKIYRGVLTTMLSLAVPIIYTGSTLFGVKNLLGYLGITNPTVTIISELLAIIGTAYSFSVTQGITNWKLVTHATPGDQGLIAYVRSELGTLNLLLQITALTILLVGIPVSFATLGLWGYYGTDVLFRYFGVQNPTLLTILDTIVGLSSSTSSVYFALRVGKKNLFWVLQQLSGRLPQEPIIWRKGWLALAVGNIRMIGHIATVNLCVKKALRLAPWFNNLSASIIEKIAAALVITGESICSENRAIQLYHRFVGTDITMTPAMAALCKKSRFMRLLERLHDINGWLYIASMTALVYISYMDVEQQMDLPHDTWYMIILNSIGSLSCSLVEEAFTRRALYRETRELFYTYKQSLAAPREDENDAI